jgi:nucleoside-triphosphatase THEP1
MGDDLVRLTASGAQGVGKSLLMEAIVEFLNTDELSAGPALAKFRSVYGPKVVILVEEQA